jgi:hypothetical protein
MPTDVTITEPIDASFAPQAETLRLQRLALGAKKATVIRQGGVATTLVSVWRSPDAAMWRSWWWRHVGATVLIVAWIVIPFIPPIVKHLPCLPGLAHFACAKWFWRALKCHLPMPALWFAASLPAVIAVENDLLSATERFNARRANVETTFTRASGRASTEGEDLEIYRPSIALMLAAAACVTLVFSVAAVLGQWGNVFGVQVDDRAAAIRGAAYTALGAYAYTLYLLTNRLNSAALTPMFLINAAVRAASAMAFGALLGVLGPKDLFQGGSGTLIFFLVGFFPAWAIGAIRNKAKEIFAPDEKGCDSLPLCLIDGLDDGIVDRLAEAGLWDIQHLAAARPHEVVLRTLYPVYRVLDWMDQANLITYVRGSVTEFRKLGVRGAIDMRALYNDYMSLDKNNLQPIEVRAARAKEVLDAIAQKTALPLPSLLFIGESLRDDSLVQVILELWFQGSEDEQPGGNLHEAIRLSVLQAAREAGISFEEPKTGTDLAIPTDDKFDPAFRAALRQFLEPWGLKWDGQAADFNHMKSWDEVVNAVRAKIAIG